MEWSVANIILSILIVSVGSILQAATGLGGGLIIVPFLALISIDLVPGPILLAGMVLSGIMAYSGRNQIDWSNIKTIIIGLLAGSFIAASYISQISNDWLGVVFSVFILLAVLISIKNPNFTMARNGTLIAGMLSGFMGTSAGVGAPILAFLYQNHSGQTIRATLAVLYLVSSIIMLVFLSIAGRFGVSEFYSGLYLVPGFVIGYLISFKLARFIDNGYARVAVLSISSISAISLLLMSVLALNA